MGMISPVRFAAMTPATCATASTSPFGTPPVRIASAVAGLMRTVPAAVAVRSVGVFSLTSTMRARPCSLKCVKSDIVSPHFLKSRL